MRSPAGLADREADLRKQSVLKADRARICRTYLSHQRKPGNSDRSSHTELHEVGREVAGDALREHEDSQQEDQCERAEEHEVEYEHDGRKNSEARELIC